MDHHDHVNLLKPASLRTGGTWADFGAGAGAFTLALRELVGPEAQIYAIDKDRGSLRELEGEYRSRFGDTSKLHIIPADFSRSVDLPSLDGIVMANSLHYFRDAGEWGKRGRRAEDIGIAPRDSASGASDKLILLQLLRSYLKPGGVLLLVEYNVDSGNMWVPYPLSFETWREFAPQAGFTEPRLLATHPSRFLHEFYSALAYRIE